MGIEPTQVPGTRVLFLLPHIPDLDLWAEMLIAVARRKACLYLFLQVPTRPLHLCLESP